MKKIIIGIATGLSLTASAACFADSATAIGVVNVQQIFSHSAKMNQSKKHLQAVFNKKQATLKTEEKKLQQMMDNYKKNSSVMSKSQLESLKTKIAKQQGKLYQLQQTYAKQADMAQNKVMHSFIQSLQSAAAKVAKEKHLTAILPSSSVIYSDPSLDETSAIQKELG